MENNLPENWVLINLVEDLNFQPTGVLKYDGLKKYFSTGSIQDSNYIPEGEFNFENRPSRANREVKLNDVLQARMKNTDKGILIDNKLNGQLFSTGFIQLRSYADTYNSRLLYYLIKSDYFLNQKNDYATGSTQEALTDDGAKKIEIPLPPLPEQHRIVAKLDALFDKIESNKQRIEKIPKILKRFRQSVLAAAVSGKLTEEWRERKESDIETDFPLNWQLVKIDKLVNSTKTDLRTGPFGTALKKSEHQPSGIPVWGIESIGENGSFTGYNKIFVSKEKAKELKSFEVKGGNIIISRSGTVGEICILPNDVQYGLISTNLMKIVLNNDIILSKYFCWLFDGSQIVIDKLRELCTGSTRLFLTQTILKEIEYPLPPIEEQKEIIKRVEQLFAFADKIEARYTKAKAMLDKLPQSILAKAFRGELVAQDPNDLPAPAERKFFVYVLECTDGSWYKGFTTDILRRWKEHASGKGAEYTQKYPPVKLIHWEEFDSEEKAIKREKFFKSGEGRTWLKQNEKLGKLRQAGEPASVLLNRIKAEKEKLAAEKKGKKTKEYSIEETPVKIAAEKNVKYKKAKK